MYHVSKGLLKILKIERGVAFYVDHFYGKSWFEIIELSFIFLGFLAINQRIFEILIWYLQRIYILCAYSLSLMGISQKWFLTILLQNYYSQIMIFHKTLNIKRYYSHNFQDIITSFGHKVDMIIYILTWYRFFDKCILRGLIDKIPILSINSP